MLSYQHIYHAGNRADMHKHALLAELLAELTQDASPLTYIETHAGRGLYDVSSPEAKKTGEANDGILARDALATLPASHPYARVVKSVREAHGPMSYAGSPLIARHLLRAQDAMHLFELHPQEVKYLRKSMKGSGAQVHHADGYAGTLALPKPPRALVLIDPSFEVKSEYETVVTFMQRLSEAWPHATLALWYPMLKAGLHVGMVDALMKQHTKALHLPHQWTTPEAVRGMYGSGLVLVNAPAHFTQNHIGSVA